MIIEKYYEKNINLGNYETARIGLTIKHDKEIKSTEELEYVSGKLLALAKTIVEKESNIIREERKQKQEE